MTHTITLAVINGTPTTTSNEVARVFGKDHAKVLRDIRDLTEQCDSQFSQSNFGLAKYIDEQGKSRPAYTLTKDGFTLLAMGFTGAKALQFKIAYIDAFNKMEAALHQNPAPFSLDLQRRDFLLIPQRDGKFTLTELNTDQRRILAIARIQAKELFGLVPKVREACARGYHAKVLPDGRLRMVEIPPRQLEELVA